MALGCAWGAGAAVAQVLPPGAEPGRQLPQPVMPQATVAAPRIEVPQSTAAQAPAGAQELRFTLQALDIEGVTAFTAEEVRALYAGLLSREVSVADLFGVANALELRYRNAGYVTSRVVVPQQTVDDGRFRLVVVEGFIADIVYQGDVGPARAAVERVVNRLRGVKPVALAEIERRLLLSNDLAGLTVRGALEPSPDVPGGSVLVVSVQRRANEGQVTLDSRVSPYLGAGVLQVSHGWDAIGERADRFTLSARTSLPTKRSAAVSAGYDALVGAEGAMLSLALSHARSNPRRELTALDVKSRVTSASGIVTLPLIRSREQNLRAFGQLELRNVDTDITGTRFTSDRLRVVRAGLSYDRSDSFDGITTVRGTLHQGLGAGGNRSPLASRAGGRSDFTKFTLDMTRLQQLGSRFSAVASVTSQFAPYPLLASEEIALGGPNFGRAYDEGEVAADNGVAVTLELRYVPPVQALPLQLYGFVDAGRVWAAGAGRALSPNKLASAGGGVRTRFTERVFASLEVAKPLNAQVRTEGNKRARAFVSLTAQF